MGLTNKGQSVMLARGGGGGSSSGGGGGGSSRSHSSGSGGARGVPLTPMETVILLFVIFGFFSLIIVAGIIGYKAEMKRRKLLKAALDLSAERDPTWKEDSMRSRVSEVFHGFQKAWSDLDATAMKGLLTEAYYRRMVLELNVLINLKRKNTMTSVTLYSIEFDDVHDDANDIQDSFVVTVAASAVDSIVDTETGHTLHSDSSKFSEDWKFRKEGGEWKLDLINQYTESEAMKESPIAEFSVRNGFYYDPDFGWLMMPKKGHIFSAANFGTSDINNHVIGYYREKIVEFYTYRPVVKQNGTSSKNYVIAQAILSISHHDILVRKRKFLLNFTPSGMREVSLEWGDFNKKFFVCADPLDRVTSLELLNPKFMAKIHDLPFELNIEVVGNVLYLYTLDRSASYDQMLEVLSWAFDEMKL